MTNDERTMGMLCHLLGIFTNFVGPLIIWLIKKDSSPYVDAQGKNALNFQLSFLIYYAVSGILCFILIGFLIEWILGILYIIFAIIGTVKASNGEFYKYPMAIELIK